MKGWECYGMYKIHVMESEKDKDGERKEEGDRERGPL